MSNIFNKYKDKFTIKMFKYILKHAINEKYIDNIDMRISKINAINIINQYQLYNVYPNLFMDLYKNMDNGVINKLFNIILDFYKIENFNMNEHILKLFDYVEYKENKFINKYTLDMNWYMDTNRQDTLFDILSSTGLITVTCYRDKTAKFLLLILYYCINDYSTYKINDSFKTLLVYNNKSTNFINIDYEMIYNFLLNSIDVYYIKKNMINDKINNGLNDFIFNTQSKFSNVFNLSRVKDLYISKYIKN